MKIVKIENKITQKEAFQYREGMDDAVLYEFMGESNYTSDENNLFIHTLEGTMTANDGDWIIKGLRGEFYPCKPDVFENSYNIIGEVT